MAYGELYLPPEPLVHNKGRNLANGQFLPGHEPHNKGMSWDEYVGKRAQKRMKRGWKNLDKYRPKERSEKSGRSKKPVIVIDKEGNWKYFSDGNIASENLGICKSNVYRCCRENEKGTVDQRTGKQNYDHACRGLRFYFETDSKWISRIAD